MKSIYALLFLFVSHSTCQSLITALSGYAQLSQFRDLLKEHPKYVRNVSSTSSPITILAATNDAFINYELQTGESIHSLNPALVDDVLLYQTFNQTVQPHEYASSEGFITETWLTDPTYDLRNTLDSGAKPGQVVWLSSTNTSLAVRQLSSTFAQSGTGTQVAIEPITGKWDKGTFIAVNGHASTSTKLSASILTPPQLPHPPPILHRNLRRQRPLLPPNLPNPHQSLRHPQQLPRCRLPRPQQRRFQRSRQP
jgi:uncharacterized surface protein with fasciclin (FAS1) repeats